MTGETCRLCGGDMEEIAGGDGMQCDTCGFVVHSDGSEDFSYICEDYFGSWGWSPMDFCR